MSFGCGQDCRGDSQPIDSIYARAAGTRCLFHWPACCVKLPSGIGMQSFQIELDNWLIRNVGAFKVVFRIIFGAFWLIDGTLKFQPGVADAFPDMVKSAAEGQLTWLSGWIPFWASTTSSNSSFFVYSVGVLEVAIAVCLVLGLLLKLAYTAAFLLSLVIWSAPQGFGGLTERGQRTLGPAVFGPSRYSLDSQIEQRFPGWKKVAEIRSI